MVTWNLDTGDKRSRSMLEGRKLWKTALPGHESGYLSGEPRPAMAHGYGGYPSTSSTGRRGDYQCNNPQYT